MRTLYSALTLFAASSLAAAPLAAQQVIDQNQPSALGVFAAMNQGWSGQSFVQSGSNISGFGLYMRNYGSTGTTPIDFRLYDAIPNGSNSPTVLRSGTVSATLLGNLQSSEWIDFLFTPYDVTPGTALFLAVSGPSAGFQVYDFFSTGGVAYAAGDAYLTNGPNNMLNAGTDLTFRTYTTLAQPVTTPEPASLTLLATGLIGIAGAARCRARRRP